MSAQSEITMKKSAGVPMSVFERHLTVGVPLHHHRHRLGCFENLV
jgi:hypothetical protein